MQFCPVADQDEPLQIKQFQLTIYAESVWHFQYELKQLKHVHSHLNLNPVTSRTHSAEVQLFGLRKAIHVSRR